jgi:chromosomal replication initiator protein
VISGLFSIPMPSPKTTPSRASRNDSGGGLRGEARFVVGPENGLVRELVRAVTSNPPTYNPLVIYGTSGVGKTTLAHLLADQWQQAHPGKSIILTTAADLARALAHAAETNSVADLRTRHQRCDLLLIDDLHQLADRHAAQQFLTTTIDALVRRGVLVIATLRQLPVEIGSLLPMLASRLSAGLVVPLVPPAALARQEIVRQLAVQLDMRLSDDITARLVGTARRRPSVTTVPQLRHAMMQLASAAAHGRHDAQPLDGDQADVKSVFRQITTTVARHFQITATELKGKSRRQHVVEARSTAIHLCRTLTDASLAEIGRHFGNRDHTTVLHACQKMQELVRHEPSFARTLDNLATQVATDPRA